MNVSEADDGTSMPFELAGTSGVCGGGNAHVQAYQSCQAAGENLRYAQPAVKFAAPVLVAGNMCGDRRCHIGCYARFKQL